MLQGREDIQKGLVPNVKGLGLREAVALLEKAGYTVSFEGHGIVSGQVPAAGDSAHNGKIALTLKEQYKDEAQ